MTSAREMDDSEAAALVDRLLSSGVPLSLLADLISPFGPESQRDPGQQAGDPTSPDEGKFSQPPNR